MALQYDTIELYPTNDCQLYCAGCYLHHGTDKWDYDTTSQIIKSGIFKRVEREVNILGGEPTTWEYLLELLEEIRLENKRVKITITTNGVKLLNDESYFDSFIHCCRENKVTVNVSWHDNKEILKVVSKLKKNNVLGCVIFVPNSIVNLQELDAVYNKIKTLCKCVWRPLIITDKNYVYFNKKITEFLSGKSKKEIQSSKRLVNRKYVDNVELIGKTNSDDKFYQDYECKCGRNAVIYVDGKLYHCLSQAISGDKPISLRNKKEIKWKSCRYKFCCCDTFELREKKKKC